MTTKANGSAGPARSSFWSSVAVQDIAEGKKTADDLGLKVFQPTIRSSGIADFEICPRLYMYRYRLGLSPKRYSPAASVGTWYHEAMALLCEVWGDGSFCEEMTFRLRRKQDDAKERANLAGFMPWGESLEKHLAKTEKDHTIAVALALWSWKYYPLDTTKWKVLDVEKLVEVDIELKGVVAPIRIRVDTLLRNRATGHLWFQDHKTTGKDTLQLASTLMWNTQQQLYRLALEAAYPDEKIAGVIHNIIQVPAIRQRTARQPETFDQFVLRLIETCEERQHLWNTANIAGTTPEKGPVHLHSEIEFMRPALDEELAIKLRTASLASRCRLHFARFPRVSHACYKFTSACPFLRLCSTPCTGWTSEIDQHFDVAPRDLQDNAKEEAASAAEEADA